MSGLRIIEILLDTTVDGPGFRTSIYAAGCPHRCPGCHNPQSWDRCGGRRYDIEEVMDIVASQELAGVTFTGGDPMIQPEGFTALAELIKRRTSKTIWCYSGFTFEQVMADRSRAEMLRYLDVLVDGPYRAGLRDPSLRFRGSGNQRIIDARASLSAGCVVEWSGDRMQPAAIPVASISPVSIPPGQPG